MARAVGKSGTHHLIYGENKIEKNSLSPQKKSLLSKLMKNMLTRKNTKW